MRIIQLAEGFSGNTYIISADGSDKCLIVDAGVSAGTVAAACEKYALLPVAILLTHGHFDHIYELDRIRTLFGIPAYVHTDEQNFLTDPRLSLFSFIQGGGNVRMSPAEQTFEDGYELRLASLKVRVIHTPGHTAGSCCFEITDEPSTDTPQLMRDGEAFVCSQAIFTGDTLFADSIGRTDFPSGSFDVLADSVARLRTYSLGKETLPLFSGHGEMSTLGKALENVRHRFGI